MSPSPRHGSHGHARIHGSPGERARLAGLIRTVWPLFAVIAVAGYLLGAALSIPGLDVTLVGILFLVLGVILAAALNTSRGRLAAFLKGARGEEWVAHELAFLPDDFTIFHGVSLKGDITMSRGGDFDHIIVGPTGIFVVETKNWNSTITVEAGGILYDGQVPDRSPLDQVKQAATALRTELEQTCGARLEVKPIVCFAANTVAQGDHGVAGVIVCNAHSINRVIRTPVDVPLPEATRARVCRHLEAAVRQ